MTLDERVREGLRRSADTGRLDEDAVFEGIQTTYSRGLVRARVLRQATTVAIVLTLVAGVGVFISWRAAPERYRTTATVAVAAGVPTYPSNARAIVLAPSTRRATLLAGNLPPDDTRIRFQATSPGNGRLSLAVTAPSTNQSELVTRYWVAEIARASNEDAQQRLTTAIRNNSAKVRTLLRRLRTVDAELVKVDPFAYSGIAQFDSPGSHLPGGPGPKGPPPVPERGTVRELNLAFLRIQILTQITHLGEEAASLRFARVTPGIAVHPFGPPSTARVSQTPRATWFALAGWFVALLLVLTGGMFVYRRRASSTSPTSG